ncbi:hypothetical protein VOLCADRAFT_91503 [Volvox carteri f. nagariensis]|uniref:Uncharacterized protein n=1 Tax=Volvox carteri f. nagariensis TaxID=3068 RepID=D8TX88_VOLCA|nr:uncharacterized protein VOLCADRAFT_91503 [Volvox carteri f. nagariensis]EFJ47869.1 hypothetical protein VOLCADRAFT_91503 [Volvox carteri f. nagariensis]|eukprot:XP_002950975.1 hypothetical protein VOLCADRAFT_91503 [Volvox carteri f. nagariensis]
MHAEYVSIASTVGAAKGLQYSAGLDGDRRPSDAKKDMCVDVWTVADGFACAVSATWASPLQLELACRRCTLLHAAALLLLHIQLRAEAQCIPICCPAAAGPFEILGIMNFLLSCWQGQYSPSGTNGHPTRTNQQSIRDCTA